MDDLGVSHGIRKPSQKYHPKSQTLEDDYPMTQFSVWLCLSRVGVSKKQNIVHIYIYICIICIYS